jgi:hypothetical protein
MTDIPYDPIAYSIQDAVRASGISRSMLYLAIARGELTARKCGARTIVLDSDLRRFLRSLPPLATGIKHKQKES